VFCGLLLANDEFNLLSLLRKIARRFVGQLSCVILEALLTFTLFICCCHCLMDLGVSISFYFFFLFGLLPQPLLPWQKDK